MGHKPNLFSMVFLFSFRVFLVSSCFANFVRLKILVFVSVVLRDVVECLELCAVCRLSVRTYNVIPDKERERMARGVCDSRTLHYAVASGFQVVTGLPREVSVVISFQFADSALRASRDPLCSVSFP